MKLRSALLMVCLAGCSASPPGPTPTPVDLTPGPPGVARLWAELATGTVSNSADSAFDPFHDAFFYSGDMHFHSGFSGDSSADREPLAAFQVACARTPELARRYGPRLGGFFFCVTDHIMYVKTRADMDDQHFQILRRQADDLSLDRSGPQFTFTALAGAELTGLARAGHPLWDDKFGHLNLFLMDSIGEFTESDVSANPTGGEAMDRFARHPEWLGQFNHPGYADEPRTGDDADHLYPYTPARDQVFRLIEVNNDHPEFWETGVAQYNVCLRQGYHVSPVVGSDLHNTKAALTGQARTVVVMPSSLGRSLEERRAMLMGYLRMGRVFATENPTLEITWSLNHHPMGSRLARPHQAVVEVSVACNNSPISTIELVGDRDFGMADSKIERDTDCTQVLLNWRPKAGKFVGRGSLDSDRLENTHYLYLKVTLASGQRAVSAPCYFESEAVKESTGS